MKKNERILKNIINESFEKRKQDEINIEYHLSEEHLINLSCDNLVEENYDSCKGDEYGELFK